jgi:hypothetical protein
MAIAAIATLLLLFPKPIGFREWPGLVVGSCRSARYKHHKGEDDMSASACIGYVGLRYEVMPDEIDRLEERSDPRQTAAKRVGLTSYWGNFGSGSDRYLLLVGTSVATLGPENDMTSAVPIERLLNIASDTAERLRSAELIGDISLHLEWLVDS